VFSGGIVHLPEAAAVESDRSGVGYHGNFSIFERHGAVFDHLASAEVCGGTQNEHGVRLDRGGRGALGLYGASEEQGQSYGSEHHDCGAFCRFNVGKRVKIATVCSWRIGRFEKK
jgi:hypothetical protein